MRHIGIVICLIHYPQKRHANLHIDIMLQMNIGVGLVFYVQTISLQPNVNVYFGLQINVVLCICALLCTCQHHLNYMWTLLSPQLHPYQKLIASFVIYLLQSNETYFTEAIGTVYGNPNYATHLCIFEQL